MDDEIRSLKRELFINRIIMLASLAFSVAVLVVFCWYGHKAKVMYRELEPTIERLSKIDVDKIEEKISSIDFDKIEDTLSRIDVDKIDKTLEGIDTDKLNEAIDKLIELGGSIEEFKNSMAPIISFFGR